MESLVAFVRNWLQADRIRIAPGDGRLLRLQPGQKLLLRGVVYQVREVALDVPESNDLIVLVAGDQGVARLIVHRTASGGCAGAQLVSEDGQQLDIFDDDVQVLPRGHENAVEPPWARWTVQCARPGRFVNGVSIPADTSHSNSSLS